MSNIFLLANLIETKCFDMSDGSVTSLSFILNYERPTDEQKESWGSNTKKICVWSASYLNISFWMPRLVCRLCMRSPTVLLLYQTRKGTVCKKFARIARIFYANSIQDYFTICHT